MGGPIFPIITAPIHYLDQGTLVPLYYLWDKGKHKTPLIPMSFCSLSLKDHYRFGQFLGEYLKKDSHSWSVIASGDLSHRIAPYSPAGYSPKAKEFDRKLIEFIAAKEIKKILNMNIELIDEAGECGLRSIVLLLGILSGFSWEPKILSYEAPFGVGYLVAELKISN